MARRCRSTLPHHLRWCSTRFWRRFARQCGRSHKTSGAVEGAGATLSPTCSGGLQLLGPIFLSPQGDLSPLLLHWRCQRQGFHVIHEMLGLDMSLSCCLDLQYWHWINLTLQGHRCALPWRERSPPASDPGWPACDRLPWTALLKRNHPDGISRTRWTT